jgi:putative aldouronate transport system substrate-binding protein
MFGNQFNAYYINPEQVGSWEETAKLNKDAIPSLALGFAASTENIKTEIAQVSALVKQYNWPLQQGRLDPATGIPEFISKMKASGMDKILSDVQNQLNAWKKANP